MTTTTDFISIDAAGSLGGLLRERAKRSPNAIAYRDFNLDSQTWVDRTWRDIVQEAARWQAAFKRQGLKAGDRVALILRNCSHWAAFDQAAMGLGLVIVPVYVEDRPENSAYCLNDSGAKLLFLEGDEHWRRLKPVLGQMPQIERFVTMRKVADDEPRLVCASDWLQPTSAAYVAISLDASSLATIVYTSGTTGRPKGVMLSHRNIMSNAWSA
ncbi:MAG: AMP-binding protein, partial [Burkholderiales bacterium]